MGSKGWSRISEFDFAVGPVKEDEMTETRKFREFELVELLEDLPAYQVSKGELGVVVQVFDSPTEAYDIEFVDDSGRESRFAYSVKPSQLRSAEETTSNAECLKSSKSQKMLLSSEIQRDGPARSDRGE